MAHSPARVLVMAPSLDRGGTEKVACAMAAALDPARFAATVHSPTSGPLLGQCKKDGIACHVGADLLGLLDGLEPHIVHIHRAGWPEPARLRPLKLHRRARADGLPRVVETNVFGRHDPASLDLVDRVLFVSRFCLHRYAAQQGLGLPQPRLDFLYNPVDTDFFQPAQGPPQGFVVGRLARQDPGKWSDLAVAFLPHLTLQGAAQVASQIPEFRYRMVGWTDQAKAFVHDHGLHDRVSFEAPLESEAATRDFLQSLSVLAHANDTGESFGLAIAEAMACGLPVVTHPARDLRDNAQLELVDHGVTGYVADSPEAYAKALAELARDSAKARAMGAAGRAKALRLYDSRVVAARLQDIYEQLLGERG